MPRPAPPSRILSRTPRRVVLATAAAVAVGALTGLSGHANAATPDPAKAASSRVVTHTTSQSQRSAALKYWTPQRLHAAKAVPTSSTLDKRTVHSLVASGPDGPMGRVSGGAAVPQRIHKTKATVTPSYNVYVPTTSYTSYPYSMNGKVFFTNNGGNYVCSGTAVTGVYNGVRTSEVWTAGHCVANTNLSSPGVWDSNVIFIPGYNGRATTTATREPFGRYTGIQSSTAYNWLYGGDRTVDLGAFKVGTGSTGRLLYQAVGWAGFMWNASATQTFDAFGYPQAAPYDGTLMYHYRAPTSGRVSVAGGSGQAQVGMENPMTGGSSGGAWFVGWSTSGPGWINGHNDWKYDSAHVYSPYFDSLANTVRCFGASSC